MSLERNVLRQLTLTRRNPQMLIMCMRLAIQMCVSNQAFVST